MGSGRGVRSEFCAGQAYGELGLACETTEATSGLKMEVYTTEPVAHFYTAKYLNTVIGKGGKAYGPFEAFCVETQHYPNSVNVPSFPTTILRPGETYLQTTIFKVSH